MNKTLKTAAVSALAGLAALVALPTASYAGRNADIDLWLEFGGHHGPRAGVILDGPRHLPKPRGGHHHDDFPRPRDPDWMNGPKPDRVIIRHVAKCTVDKAVRKAENAFGLRRVRVEFANKHVIGVEGRRKGHWVDIVFARAPGCPVIDY